MSSLIHKLATDLSVLDSRIELRRFCSLMSEVLCLCKTSSTSKLPKWSPSERNESNS